MAVGRVHAHSLPKLPLACVVELAAGSRAWPGVWVVVSWIYHRVAMGRANRVTVGLLERDEELDALKCLLDVARAGRGCVVLVEGPAGIGKTCLLAPCADAAERRGMAVLRVRGDELVMESSFAAVRELLWPEVHAVGGNALDGAARWAAPVFEGDPVSGALRY